MIERGSTQSKALALLVAASPAIALLIGFGALAGQRWGDAGDRLAEAREETHVIEATVRQTEGYEPVRAVWREYAASDVAGLVRGVGESGADDAVRDRIAEIFARFDGVFIGAEPLPSDASGALRRLRIEARGETPERSVAAFLEALEMDTPYIFVDALDAQRMNPSEAEGGETRVALRLSVSAYWLAEEEGR